MAQPFKNRLKVCSVNLVVNWFSSDFELYTETISLTVPNIEPHGLLTVYTFAGRMILY